MVQMASASSQSGKAGVSQSGWGGGGGGGFLTEGGTKWQVTERLGEECPEGPEGRVEGHSFRKK